MTGKYVKELEAIRRKHRGKLLPKHVVEFARDPNTALHERFDWDDSVAAEKWRLEQAKFIIRVSVTLIPAKNGEMVKARAYVSLPSDRKEGKGYRTVQDVLADKATTAEALTALRHDIAALERKYSVFTALKPMLQALVAVVNEPQPSKPVKMAAVRTRRPQFEELRA